MEDSYYTDGSVVQVGDIVKIDLEATHHSYSGWVSEMDLLSGIELSVTGIKTRIATGVAILYVAPLDDDAEIERILDTWAFSSDMFVLSSKCDVDIADAAGLTEFLEGV